MVKGSNDIMELISRIWYTEAKMNENEYRTNESIIENAELLKYNEMIVNICVTYI